MAIDLSKMKAKLDSLRSKGENGGGDKQSVLWKITDGDHDVRIVSPSDGDPFRDLHFHYMEVNGKNVSILCPKRNFGDECPICEFASSLWKESSGSGDQEGMKMAKSLFVKQRFFSPVLVRGEEDKGVRIWGYGKSTYETLLGLVLNPDYGDITDIDEGTDLTLTYGKTSGASYAQTKIQPRRKTSPLCNDKVGGKERCGELLKNIPSVDTIYPRRSTADVQKALDEFLADETSAGEDVVKYNKTNTNRIDQAYEELMGD
jgi:hypothetical protein